MAVGNTPAPAAPEIGQATSAGTGPMTPKPATPQPGTPEYSAWWRQSMADQGIQGQVGLGAVDANAQIEADRARVMAQQPAGGTGQFGTAPARPGLNEIAASVPTAQFGAGAALAGAPRAATTGGQALTGPASRLDAPGLNGAPAEPTKVGTAANQASAALGPAPQMDVGFADRQLGAYQEALGMSRDVLDRLLNTDSVFDAQTQSTIDRLLNAPNMAKAMGARALEQQLAVARSARGGPGAVQDALNAAQQQAPQLTAQATQAATQEDLARTQAAGQLAAQGSATEAGRLATAGNVAGNFAQAALGARGQDVQIQQTNVDAASKMVSEIARLTGTQLQLDQQNEQFLGQMARDWAQLDFDFSKMSIDDQNRWFDRQVQIYGIDQQTAAQMKAIAAGENIGPADWFNGIVGVIGAAAGVGAAAVGGK